MEKYTDYWDSLCQIYFLTKHYLLIAEELSDDFDTFLQPVKEHRDAFDHIARVFGTKYMETEVENINIETYRVQNMRKAVGHAYRAFFDTADWLSYVCRQKIRKIIVDMPKNQLIEKYPRYDELKEKLIQIPKDIAKIRGNKDVSDSEDVLIKEVERYTKILDELIKDYSDICKVFL